MEEYREAGRILERVMKEWMRRIEKGMNDRVVAEEIERALRTPAFPCNLSKDREAAHYTPYEGRPLEGVVKVDCGVHVDGYIADAAFTLDLTGEYGKLVEAAERALEEAVKSIKPGVRLKEVGERVERVVRSYGFKPVVNLGGHSIGRYTLHGGKFVPNVGRGEGVVSEGDVLAVEPFVSTGRGFVVEGNQVEIFSLRKTSAMVGTLARFKGLPFARRWLSDRELLTLTLLRKRGMVEEYPVLVDTGIVAQAETTVIVEKDGAEPIVKHFSFL